MPESSRVEGPKTWLLCALLCLVAALPYCASLNATFALDDYAKIVQSRLVLEGGLSLGTVKELLGSQDAPRAIPTLSFIANHAAFGLDKTAFRIVNIAIHCANALLLFAIGLRLLKQAMPDGPSELAAFFAALLWALSPLMLTSVVYIVQRENSLAAMLCFGSFLCYLEGRGRSGRNALPLLSGAAALWLAAMLCKQNVAPLPLMMLLCETLVFGRRDKAFLKLSLAAIAATCLLAFVAAGFVLKWDFGSVFRHYSNLHFTLGERLLSEPRAVSLYILAFLLPLPSLLRLDMDDFPVSHGLLTPPSTLLAIIFLALLAAAALRLWRKEPLLAFCVAWIFGMLFVESSFISLELAYLHRLYLPGAMLALAISYLAFKLLSGSKAPVILLIYAAAFAMSTFCWSLDWRDETTLWKSELGKSPGNLRALTSLGIAYQNAGRKDDALNVYERALKANSSLWRCHSNAGIILMESGDMLGAERHLGAAYKLLPENPEIAKAFGTLLARAGRDDEAAQVFSKASASQTALDAGADYNLGLLAASSGDFSKAIACFDRELKRSPGSWRAWKAKGDAFASLDKASEAAESYAKALELNPRAGDAACGLGLALFNLGKFQESTKAFEQASSLGVASPELERGLGSSLAMSGKLKEAEPHLRKALAMEPASVETIDALASLMAMTMRYKEAEELFAKALKIRPDDQAAANGLRKLKARKE